MVDHNSSAQVAELGYAAPTILPAQTAEFAEEARTRVCAYMSPSGRLVSR
jgi:hypothetical protein